MSYENEYRTFLGRFPLFSDCEPPCSVQIQENTNTEKFHIWALITQFCIANVCIFQHLVHKI